MPTENSANRNFENWKDKAQFATKDDLAFFKEESGKIDRHFAGIARQMQNNWEQTKTVALKTGTQLTGMSVQEIKQLDANNKRLSGKNNAALEGADNLLNLMAQNNSNNNKNETNPTESLPQNLTATMTSKHTGAAINHKRKHHRTKDMQKAVRDINTSLKRELWDITGSRELSDRLMRSFLKNAEDKGYEFATWRLGFDLLNRSGSRRWEQRVVENFGLRESADGGPLTISQTHYRLKHAINDIHEQCDTFTAEKYWQEIEKNPELAEEKLMSSVDIEELDNINNVDAVDRQTTQVMTKSLALAGRKLQAMTMVNSAALSMEERKELLHIISGMADVDMALHAMKESSKAADMIEKADKMLRHAEVKQAQIRKAHQKARETQANSRDRQYGD